MKHSPFATDCERSCGQADPARLQERTHRHTEFPVTIKDDVAVRAWKRQRLSELLHNPLDCRMRGRVEVQNPPPIVLDDQQAVQYAETQRGHGEEIEGGHHLAVIPQECHPALDLGLVGLALQPLQIARHGGLRNVKSELK